MMAAQEEREAPPRLGDIVVYAGDSAQPTWAARRDEKREFIVASEGHGHAYKDLYCVQVAGNDWFWAGKQADLRVIRRASYREVGE